jgi:hypothetical protein
VARITAVVGETVDLASGGRGKLLPGDDVGPLEGAEPLGQEIAAEA